VCSYELDNIIEQFLNAYRSNTALERGDYAPAVPMPAGTILKLCKLFRDLVMKQPPMVEMSAPVHVVGDIHGQFQDLLRMFNLCGAPSQDNPFLFLGNYVDHGKSSLETMCLLMAYKLKFPDHFFLLRGKHESASLNRAEGFFDECKRRYNIKMWRVFSDVFNCLPHAGIVARRAFCVSGGLSADLHDLDQLRQLKRPTEVGDVGLLCDLLWADPLQGITGFVSSKRGRSFAFGADELDKFLDKFDLDFVVRGSQVVEDGYEFFGKRKLVTIFSAPDYQGLFDNAGACMVISRDLTCSFKVLTAAVSSATAPTPPPVEEPRYDPSTGAPLNQAAQNQCAAQWQAGEADCVRELPYSTVQAAIGSFGKKNLLGGGSSCKVYSGNLFGLQVAVKHLSSESFAGATEPDAEDWANKQFAAEMNLLVSVSHINICRLFAYSIDGPHRCIVLEMCTGGPLDKRILCVEGSEHPPLPSWQRILIAFNIAAALNHLHSMKPPMLHRDVKSANVLLDADGVAKVADFGTVKEGAVKGKDLKSHLTCRSGTPGTRGYMPNEYSSLGHVSEKTGMKQT
jgi:serine/threonine-protein phosphatase PP1 catalytic subunit